MGKKERELLSQENQKKQFIEKDMKSEFEKKITRIEKFLQEQELDGLLLADRANISWLTGGRDTHIEIIEKTGSAKLLILPAEGHFVITNQIEEQRLKEEESLEENFDFRVERWTEEGKILKEYINQYSLASDIYLPETNYHKEKIARLRYQLTTEEITRSRQLGRESSKIITTICREVTPGQTEKEIAGMVANYFMAAGIKPAVVLIGADERIFQYRHPIPTDKELKNYLMVVVCPERAGLILSLTRLVHFGEPGKKLRNKLGAAQQVEVTMWENTRPGRNIGDVFKDGVKAYQKLGYEQEWKLHHQGGPAGYKTRDFLATPNCKEEVLDQQLYAWNPSITGVKTEDTTIIANNNFEVITEDPDWPLHEIEYDGKSYNRPDFLIR